MICCPINISDYYHCWKQSFLTFILNLFYIYLKKIIKNMRLFVWVLVVLRSIFCFCPNLVPLYILQYASSMHVSHPLFPAGRSRSRGDLQTGRSSPAAGLSPSSSCRGNSSPASLPPAFRTTSASSARLHGTSQDPRLPELCHFYSLQRWCPEKNKLKFRVGKDISAHQSCIYMIQNTV